VSGWLLVGVVVLFFALLGSILIRTGRNWGRDHHQSGGGGTEAVTITNQGEEELRP